MPITKMAEVQAEVHTLWLCGAALSFLVIRLSMVASLTRRCYRVVPPSVSAQASLHLPGGGSSFGEEGLICLSRTLCSPRVSDCGRKGMEGSRLC